MEDTVMSILENYLYNKKVRLLLYPEEITHEEPDKTYVEGFVQRIYKVNLGYCVDTRVEIDGKEYTINRDRTFIIGSTL